MASRFLQIHFLTAYPASLLNRDDVGFAKRVPFGGVTRTRISSQCLKRHWRTFDGEGALRTITDPQTGAPVALSVRSRHTFDREIAQPLKDKGFAPEVVDAVVSAFMEDVLGKGDKEKGGGKKQKKAKGLQTNQVTVLGRPEVRYLLGEAEALCRDAEDPEEAATRAKDRVKAIRKNLQALRLGAGLDAALFGRMVTSDNLARCDAAVHVAHAFTVHAEETEADYFSAVDDLLQGTGAEEAELGSGHIGSTELTSGLFYGYVAIDVPLLVSNLEGCAQDEWTEADRTLAGEVVSRLVRIIATVSPGAKRGSTAPYAYADFVMVEAGEAQPCTLANAFLKPVPPGGDVVAAAYRQLGDYLERFDAVYEPGNQRRYVSVSGLDGLANAQPCATLKELCSWAGEQVTR